ncbi:MAG TPA: hypothetical protein VGH74_17945, partial [Planctomycetaceae bacterium]
GFYWYQPGCGNDYVENWCRHVIALIRADSSAEFLHAPFFAGPACLSASTPGCSRDMIASVRDEWLKQMELHPSRVQVVDNAAIFFARFDPLVAANICQSAHPEPYGPDITLAEELFATGACDTVAEYFTTCASHWNEGRAMLEGWADDIQRGLTPDLPPLHERSNGRVWA